uniref:Homeobox domain-containing protein n=1 Tax=Angiostrongylus cantonensis TaxID=6313 RepID=A0A158P5U3_ANGCA
MVLFTVEQLELIRRLRSTGISPAQIAEAQPPVPVTISASPSEIVSESPERLSIQTVPPASVAAPSEPTTSQTPDSSVNVSEAAAVPSSTAPLPTAFRYENNIAGRPIRSSRTPMKEITTLDRPEELDEFMEQGEEACIADMKQFITQYSLRQTTVAMMTGVSQPYISKLLNGNHRELSLRCRKNIYCWYLNCRRHPHKLSVFFADPSTRLETNGDGELVPQRRERYVFRPILIKILEGFFTQSPFPDLNKRVEIASACNQVLQIEKRGVALMPKEVVSPQVVANWFANKRKELRRRSQEASEQVVGITTSQPTTPAHVFNEEATSSGIGSSPSPIMEEPETADQRDMESRPLDVIALAARLGIAFPQLTATTSLSEAPYSCTLPIASLASRLLNSEQQTTSYNDESNQKETALRVNALTSQLIPTTPVSLVNSLIAPSLQILSAQFPVLNELCSTTEQQTLDTSSTTAASDNLLSMTYDHPHHSMLKTESME